MRGSSHEFGSGSRRRESSPPASSCSRRRGGGAARCTARRFSQAWLPAASSESAPCWEGVLTGCETRMRTQTCVTGWEPAPARAALSSQRLAMRCPILTNCLHPSDGQRHAHSNSRECWASGSSSSSRRLSMAIRQPDGFGASYFGDSFAWKSRRNAFARRGKTCTGSMPAGVPSLNAALGGASSRSLTQVTN